MQEKGGMYCSIDMVTCIHTYTNTGMHPHLILVDVRIKRVISQHFLHTEMDHLPDAALQIQALKGLGSICTVVTKYRHHIITSTKV